MSDAAPIETALLQADHQAHATRPVPDLLFRLGGLIVLASLALMVAGPWLTPFDVGRPSEDIMVSPPDLTEVPRLLWTVLTGVPHEPVHNAVSWIMPHGFWEWPDSSLQPVNDAA